MARIDSIFAAARAEGRTLLMPYVTAGSPSLEVTERVLPALEAAGASIAEIGIPFSDPIADGPVIAAAMHRALESGVTLENVFACVKRARPTTEMGLIGMVSESIVYRHGVERFLDDAAAAGLDGLIVPDLDLADAPSMRDAAAARGLSFTLLVAPTTPAARMADIAGACRGFVYLLARVGITGESSGAPEIAPRVAALRAATDLPIAVGFGIARPEHVAAVTAHADAAIVGSALVRRMEDADDPVAAASDLVASLAGGLAAGATR